jgi:hypothetical protein
VDFDQPVYEDGSHLFREVGLGKRQAGTVGEEQRRENIRMVDAGFLRVLRRIFLWNFRI